MKTVTIVLTVSRFDYLDLLFLRLENLECDPEKTNLLVIVDGKPNLYVTVRNKVEMSKFAQRLCVHYKVKDKVRMFDILGRKKRIADIHNELKQYVFDCDYIFGIEDDTIVPVNALTKLLRDYDMFPFAGVIEGVQLGRWGVPYVGAWKVDDIYNPSRIWSIVPESTTDFPENKEMEEIDGCGFYCFLTKSENYTNHIFRPYNSGTMGPDFEYALSLRLGGYMNYIDWNVQTIHKRQGGDVKMPNFTPSKIVFSKKENGTWRQTAI